MYRTLYVIQTVQYIPCESLKNEWYKGADGVEYKYSEYNSLELGKVATATENKVHL
jgi:hypothetical protein